MKLLITTFVLCISMNLFAVDAEAPFGGILVSKDDPSKQMGLHREKSKSGKTIYNLVQFFEEYGWDIEGQAQPSEWVKRAIMEANRNGKITTSWEVTTTLGFGSGCNEVNGNCVSFPIKHKIDVKKSPRILGLKSNLELMIGHMRDSKNAGKKLFIPKSYFRLIEATY